MAQPTTLVCKTVPQDQVSDLIDRFADVNWRQMPAYSEQAAQQIGATSEYLGVWDQDTLIGLANVRSKSLPVIPGGIALISHGPMVTPVGQTFEIDHYRKVIGALCHFVTRQRKFGLRIESALASTAMAGQLSGVLAECGFSNQGGRQYQTFVLDLCKGEEQVRAGLNGKWRTDLRRGEKQGLDIVRTSNPDEFDEFAPLLDGLAMSKGFTAPQDTQFFKNVAENASGSERIILHKAYAGDELVAGHIGAFSGDTAVYLLGATNPTGRDLRASYVLQWEVIRHALELGMARYDLGGADEDENPSVFRFKKRMGGELMTNLPAHEAWPSGVLQAIIKRAERAYKAIKSR